MKDCVFCYLKKIKDEIFYESKYFYGIYNIKPIVPGHSLIITKRHVPRFLELNKEELEELIPTMKKVTKVLLKVYKAPDFDISLQDGKSAGQTIQHIHFHIIPRKPGDIWGTWIKHIREMEKAERIPDEVVKENVKKIKRTFKD